jgi:NADP-dependent 3-hydroxy acid dehydrogenase YdfG
MIATNELEGTVALITGASSGIGEATAVALADAGSLVVVAARRKDRLDELVTAIAERGGRAEAVAVDVTDPAAAADLVDGVVARHGRLDIVVNNAGVMLNGPVEGAPLDEWERMVDLNVKGLLYVAHAALPHLLRAAAEADARGVADLVNISSVAGRVARLGSGVYNLTKHGVNAFSESLRQEVTQRHVRVALVEPGAVATELVGHMRPESQAGFEERFADVELLQAADIADAIRYVVTRPRHMAINEVLIRPTEQQG